MYDIVIINVSPRQDKKNRKRFIIYIVFLKINPPKPGSDT
jgi:hypothetical protein